MEKTGIDGKKEFSKSEVCQLPDSMLLTNYQRPKIYSKEIGIVLIGTTIAVMGLLLDAYWTEQFWANKPPLSPGPILVGTAGLFFIFPVGLLILVSGVLAIVYNMKRELRNRISLTN